MTYNIETEHCIVANNNNGQFVDLEPLACLDVAMTDARTV